MRKDRPIVLVDVTSWEPWVHLAGALRRKGISVVRITARQRSLAQRVRIGMESWVFNDTRSVLAVDADGQLHVAGLLPLLGRAADVQMVDAVGSVLTRTRQWEQHAHLHRVGTDGLSEQVMYDKWLYTAVAAEAGVPVPRSVLVPAAVLAGDDSASWMLKARVGSGGQRVAPVASRRDLFATLHAWRTPPEDVFLQQRIEGENWIVGGVAQQGEVLACAAYQPRSAMNDPYGPSAHIRIGRHDEAVHMAGRFLEALEYTGPFAIDFIDDGTARLVDFNPRFFGSWATIQSSGVDLLGAYLSTLGVPWARRCREVQTEWLRSSTSDQPGVRGSLQRTRSLTASLRPVVGPRAALVTGVESVWNAVRHPVTH